MTLALKEPTPAELKNDPGVVWQYLLQSNHRERTIPWGSFIMGLEILYFDGGDMPPTAVDGVRKLMRATSGDVALPQWTKLHKQYKNAGVVSMREFIVTTAGAGAGAASATALVATAVRRGSLAATTTNERRMPVMILHGTFLQ